AGEGAEVAVEGAVLLHDDDDVLDGVDVAGGYDAAFQRLQTQRRRPGPADREGRDQGMKAPEAMHGPTPSSLRPGQDNDCRLPLSRSGTAGRILRHHCSP